MKLYTPCHTRDGRSLVLIRQALSWRVLILGWAGLFLYGAWISASLSGAAVITLGLILPGWGKTLLLLGSHAALAVFTPELRLWEQKLNGREISPPIAAPSRETALLRWSDGWKATHARRCH